MDPQKVKCKVPDCDCWIWNYAMPESGFCPRHELEAMILEDRDRQSQIEIRREMNRFIMQYPLK